jgi:hypothetical protein
LRPRPRQPPAQSRIVQPLPAAFTPVAETCAQGLTVAAHTLAKSLLLAIGEVVQPERTAIGIDATLQCAGREIVRGTIIFQQIAKGQLIATHREIVRAVAAIAIFVAVALPTGPIARSNAGADFLPVAGKHIPKLFALAIIQSLQCQQPAGCLNALAKFVVLQLGCPPVVTSDLVDLR